jgi:hypothetical protein
MQFDEIRLEEQIFLNKCLILESVSVGSVPLVATISPSSAVSTCLDVMSCLTHMSLSGC